MRVEIEYQDQFGSWKHFQTKHNEADAFSCCFTQSTKHREEAPTP